MYLSDGHRAQILRDTPAQIKKCVNEAHEAGCVPPHVEALRGLSYDTLKRNAELVEDPVFALFGTLTPIDLEAARQFLWAQYDSDDVPAGFKPATFASLTPLVLGMGDQDNPAALRTSDFWKHHSRRAEGNATRLSQLFVTLARHCSDYARSSGGWVYMADLISKMRADGYAYETMALAVHGLAAAQPGALEVLGLRASDAHLLAGTELGGLHEAFLHWPVKGRADRPIPVFFRACQGHSVYAADIERMYAPYDPGLAWCHGPLVHVTSMEAVIQSMMGEGDLVFPDSQSCLCHENDFGLLRLLPSKRNPQMRHPDHLPSWLRQRRAGEPVRVRKVLPPGSEPTERPPPQVGNWPQADQERLWDQLPVHRLDWSVLMIFSGKVITRFQYRPCRCGTGTE